VDAAGARAIELERRTDGRRPRRTRPPRPLVGRGPASGAAADVASALRNGPHTGFSRDRVAASVSRVRRSGDDRAENVYGLLPYMDSSRMSARTLMTRGDRIGCSRISGL
jgi:hypothetical protein